MLNLKYTVLGIKTTKSYKNNIETTKKTRITNTTTAADFNKYLCTYTHTHKCALNCIAICSCCNAIATCTFVALSKPGDYAKHMLDLFSRFWHLFTIFVGIKIWQYNKALSARLWRCQLVFNLTFFICLNFILRFIC